MLNLFRVRSIVLDGSIGAINTIVERIGDMIEDYFIGTDMDITLCILTDDDIIKIIYDNFIIENGTISIVDEHVEVFVNGLLWSMPDHYEDTELSLMRLFDVDTYFG